MWYPVPSLVVTANTGLIHGQDKSTNRHWHAARSNKNGSLDQTTTIRQSF